MSGDLYKRRYVGPDTYQCGCRWERQSNEFYNGDVLLLCPIHKQHNDAQYRAYVRKLAKEEEKKRGRGTGG